jgi:hypothetical protein
MVNIASPLRLKDRVALVTGGVAVSVGRPRSLMRAADAKSSLPVGATKSSRQL